MREKNDRKIENGEAKDHIRLTIKKMVWKLDMRFEATSLII